jgi:iron complex outermembrane receptor protein
MMKIAAVKIGAILGILLFAATSQKLLAKESPADVSSADAAQPATASGATVGESAAPALDEIIVSARKRDENLQDVPVTVSVVGAVQLQRAQVNLITDLAQQVPTLNASERGVGPSLNFSIRGVGAFAPGAGVEPGVGLVIDGVPILRSVEFDMAMVDVNNVQVLSGPQGTLFGANTIGGVINVVTNQPTSTFESTVEASATDDAEFILRAGASGPLTDNIRGRLFVYGIDRTGYVDNLYPGSHRASGEETRGVNGKLNFNITDSLSIDLLADYRRQHTTPVTHLDSVVPGAPDLLATLGGGNPAVGQAIVNNPALINSDFYQALDIKNEGVSVQVAWKLNDVFSLKSISSYRETTETNSVDIDNTPATASTPSQLAIVSGNAATFLNATGPSDYEPYRGGEILNYFTQELRLAYSTAAVDAIVGAYYSHVDESIGVGNEPTGSPFILNNGALFNDSILRADLTNYSESVFGDVTWHATHSVDLFAGYRWTHENLTNDLRSRIYVVPSTEFTTSGNSIVVQPGVAPSSRQSFDASTSDNEWSGRAGAMWRITPDLTAYASASRGITGAGANSSTTATPTSAFIFPSTAQSYEFGLKTEILEHRLRMNVALFKVEVRDLQARYADVANNTSVFINAGDLDSKGVEADATALIGEHFTLSAALTLLETRMEGGLTQTCYLGQTVAEGCLIFPNGIRAQNIDGKPGLNAPKTKFNIRPTYNVPLSSLPFDAYVGLSYMWQSKEAFELIYDPYASYQSSYGLLDIAMGITDKHHRYEVSLFGKNVLDEHYLAFSQTEVGRDARSRGFYPRDAFAYWGIKGAYHF